MSIEDIKNSIIKANDAYRKGDSIISDKEYDDLLDKLRKLSPDDELLYKIGITVTSDRKTKLPLLMASMNKVKSIVELYRWIFLKGVPDDTTVVITPKYDGISLLVDEKNNQAYTRGDGIYGEKSNEHYKLLSNKTLKYNPFDYTYGEAIIPIDIFNKKYSNKFSNARNLVAGLFNSKDISPILKDVQYIKYGGVVDFDEKTDILDTLNSFQDIKVPYKTYKAYELNEHLLIDIFNEYKNTLGFEIDGIIVEVNDIKIQQQLGREKNNNPCYSRAFKHPSFSQSVKTQVVNITWNISKQGLLKPVINIKPINIDGVTVSNVTGNNAKFIKDNGIGVGAIVYVKRSGMVIPCIDSVEKKVPFKMPIIDDVNIKWNDKNIELMVIDKTDEQEIKKNTAFFDILGAKNISIGVITQLYNAGYKTIKSLLDMTVDDMITLDDFGEKKADIVYNAIHDATTDVDLAKIQHASGIFQGLGTKKLELVKGYKTKPTIEEISSINGFAQKSAKIYVDNYDKFFNYLKELPEITIKNINNDDAKQDLVGQSFVFTGIRRKDLEEIIEQRGGKIAGSVSKKTSYLVVKEFNSGSTKETKALDMGITIINIKELEEMLCR